MTQPPDDRHQSPWEPPEPPSSEPPTVAWTPPGSDAPPPAPPLQPDAGAAPPQPPPPQNPLISASPAPQVAWAPPVTRRPEIAPGLVLSDTPARFVAYLVDLIIVGFLSSVVSTALGFQATAPTTLPNGQLDLSRMFGGVESTMVNVVLSGFYFVLSWSGGRRATLGQRMLRIQVGNAFDGAPLTFEQAIRRWLGLGEFLGLFAFAPGMVALSSTIQFVWMIALLLTTVMSPTKQGLHDRFANTAVVRPATAGSGAAMACLVIAIVIALAALAAIVGLIFLGGQASSILSAVGESI